MSQTFLDSLHEIHPTVHVSKKPSFKFCVLETYYIKHWLLRSQQLYKDGIKEPNNGLIYFLRIL